MPRSIIQISPGLVAGIFGFHGVEHEEVFVGPAVAVREDLHFLFQGEQPAGDFTALGVRQFWEFINDLIGAHGWLWDTRIASSVAKLNPFANSLLGRPREAWVDVLVVGGQLRGRTISWARRATPMQRVPQKQLHLLSRNLRRWCAGGGLKQEPLAEKAEITTRYLQQLEAAEFGASLAVLIRLRRALACRWDSLLEKIE